MPCKCKATDQEKIAKVHKHYLEVYAAYIYRITRPSTYVT